AGGAIYGDANSMSGGEAGSDYIRVADMSGGVIYGDVAVGSGYKPGENEIFITNTMSGGTINSGHGNDTVDVGVLSDSGIINAGAGADSIKVGTMSGGTLNTSVGNDSINVGTMSGGTLNAGNGNDSVSISVYDGGQINMGNGENSLNIMTQNADLQLGDISATVLAINAGTGLSDNIIIDNAIIGKRLSLDLATSGKTLEIGAISLSSEMYTKWLELGGENTLNVKDITGALYIYGDSAQTTGVPGSDSVIDITCTSTTSAVIRGDYGTLTGAISGGNDKITVNGDISSFIMGDATLMTGGSTGGDDAIVIDGDIYGADIYGDAQSLEGGASGGDDSIRVTGAISGASKVCGDGRSIKEGVTGGDDSIWIDTLMTGAEVYGDAWDMTDSTGGNDSIYITGTMNAGIIYGEGIAAPMTSHTPGNNYIEIAKFAGTQPKSIHAGDGGDTVAVLGVAVNTSNVSVSLSGGSGSGDGEYDYLDLSAMTTLGNDISITVNGFDVNNNGVYDQIIYGSGIWTTPAPEATGIGDMYVLTHNASGNKLTLMISGTYATKWEDVSEEYIP
ncbi:hypothetical protein LJC15_03870, partial [Desulfovibrio sp. OttesenSCG-928-G11]|nr:hypothetical protein [Desulfovibrio sp. OttesenSCG-928-G11]